MPESCTICIMEARIHYLEQKYDEQAGQYAKNQVDAAERMTKMEANIGKILDMQTDMNGKLTKVLEDKQNEAIENASHKNERAANKWRGFSSGTSKLAYEIIKYIVLLGVGALVAALLVKTGAA
jgi:hypothetical protein